MSLSRRQLHLGTRAYDQVLETSKLSNDGTAVNLVKTVGLRIASGCGSVNFRTRTKNYKWEFNLIDNPEPNAFALPGGKVAVYTGILKYTQNAAGLAAVMAHEIAHVLARHGSERMSQQLLVQLGQAGAGHGSRQFFTDRIAGDSHRLRNRNPGGRPSALQ